MCSSDLDLSAHRLSFDDLAALVAGVDGVISVDTVAYHLADAFSVPASRYSSAATARPELQ